MECSLYRHFDKAGVLLYVGISLSPIYRLTQHRNQSDWFSEIVRIEIETFPTRALAEEAERRAIFSEHPKHNIAHVASTHPLHALAMRVKRQTTNREILELCDGLLAISGPKVCQVCLARRQARTASQRKWRAKHSEAAQA